MFTLNPLLIKNKHQTPPHIYKNHLDDLQDFCGLTTQKWSFFPLMNEINSKLLIAFSLIIFLWCKILFDDQKHLRVTKKTWNNNFVTEQILFLHHCLCMECSVITAYLVMTLTFGLLISSLQKERIKKITKGL